MMEKQKLLSKLISTNTDPKSDEENLKDITAWNYEMDGHAHKFAERSCELTHKTVDQLNKNSTPCLDQKFWESCQRLAPRLY